MIQLYILIYIYILFPIPLHYGLITGGLNIVPEIRVKTVFVDAGAVRGTVETAEAAALKGEFADIDHVTRTGDTFPEPVYHACKCGV